MRHTNSTSFQRIAALAFVFALSVSSLWAQKVVEQNDDPQLKNIDIVEKLGSFVPREMAFTTDQGRVTTLGEYLSTGKPTILMMAYYRCPMLCNLVMNGMSDAVATMDLAPGDDYQILTVSVNPLESPELAASKKETYLAELSKKRGLAVDPKIWTFAVAQESQSRRLTEAIGFKYYFIPEKKEYAHAAVAFILSPDGKITRYFYGIEFNPRDLKLALIESSEGAVGASIDRFILYCFQYDPNAKGYVFAAARVMKIGGGLMVAILGAYLFIAWKRERRRKLTDLGAISVAGPWRS